MVRILEIANQIASAMDYLHAKVRSSCATSPSCACMRLLWRFLLVRLQHHRPYLLYVQTPMAMLGIVTRTPDAREHHVDFEASLQMTLLCWEACWDHNPIKTPPSVLYEHHFRCRGCCTRT